MIRFPFRATRRRVVGALIAQAALLPAACGGLPGLPDPGPPATSVLPSPVAPGRPTARPHPEPLVILDARPRPERAPVPEASAPCGRVDRLDFPLGPPDAVGYDARWAYGRMSRRYGKYHAGEDWLYRSGSSLGQAVFSVGHGRVEYAEPYGWGPTDKGVVILRHVFDDGSTVLSFYGHLEPASIGLEAGACIQRGEEVGRIGKPRGRPHLHFEIRDHMASQPGPGYWPSDPDQAGWHPPSQYISKRRLDALPDMHWRRALTTTTQVAPLRLPDGAVVLAEGRALSAIEALDGSQRWRLDLDSPPFDLVLDAGGDRIYWSSRLGRVEALALAAAEPPKVAWTSRASAAAHLIPLPGGGVAFHDGRALVGLSTGGTHLWREVTDLAPRHHTLDGRRIVLSSEPPRGAPRQALPRPSAWTFELDPASGRLTELSTAWGRPLVIGEIVFLHHASGIYRVDPAMARSRGPLAATRRVLDLPVALLDQGSSLVLPEDRGLVISHRGSRSSSLAMLDAEGRLLWERDATRLQALARPAQLLLHGGSLLASTERGEVFELDPSTGDARWIFDPGLRLARLPGEGIVLGAESGPLLMDFRGGELMAWDPPVERPELRAH